MPATSADRLREASKLLFGNSYRLELLAIVGDLEGQFYARQIAVEMDVADNLVASQLARLLELGLLTKEVDGPHVLYTRFPSGVWSLSKKLRAEFGSESGAQPDRVDAPSRAINATSDVAALVRADRLREASKLLFGNSYRLELLAIVGDLEGQFYARQIAVEMDVADNLVASQLARLLELGLLTKEVDGPHVLYTRCPSGVWSLSKKLRAEFGSESGAQPDRVDAPSRAINATSDVAALVRAAAAGDERAWSALVDRFSKLIWAIARNHRLGADDAAEVSQTTWLRLAEHIGRLRDPSKVGGWLATTARHESLRVLRGAGRQIPMGDDMPEPNRPAAAIDEELLRSERGGMLWQAFSRLPARDQALLRLLVSDPMPSFEEIGATLGMPVGKVGPTRARCLERLRHEAETMESALTSQSPE